MHDPLANFDWQNLYGRYDERCLKSGGYDSLAPQLSAFPERPVSDRELYYRLVSRFAAERSSGITLASYEAMLYWKLYSQRVCFSEKGILYRLENDSNLRQQVQGKLTAITGQLPRKIEKKQAEVLQLVRGLHEFKLHGMQGSCTLPVRTTFLHFVYPEAIPIFDIQVLKAVGVQDKDANEKFPVLEQYLAHAWQLTSTYSSDCSSFSEETPVRVVDMALWLIRGAAQIGVMNHERF